MRSVRLRISPSERTNPGTYRRAKSCGRLSHAAEMSTRCIVKMRWQRAYRSARLDAAVERAKDAVLCAEAKAIAADLPFVVH